METDFAKIKKNVSESSVDSLAISICVVNYNGMKYLKNTFDAIFSIGYQDFDVMLIDNASTDDSINFVEANYKDVQVVKMPENKGPNTARNYALKNAKSEYVFLLDNDAIPTKDCLGKLIKSLLADSSAVTCSPLIVDAEDPEIIQYGATHIHYAGAAIIDRKFENSTQTANNNYISTTINGTALLVNRERVNQIALFDEDMFFGWTDGDFSYRLTSAGNHCLIDPKAIVKHPKSNRSKKVIYHQVKNRWVFMLKNYSLKTLIITAPALIFYEIFLIAFIAMSGGLGYFFRAVGDIIKEWPVISKKRKEAMANKIRPDRELLRSGDFLSSQLILKNKYIKLGTYSINFILDKYWFLVKRII